MAWLVDLAEHIEDVYSGFTVGTNVFIGFMPDSPDECVVVYDAGGAAHVAGAEPPLEEHRAEIRVRSTSYSAAQTVVDALIGYLHCKLNKTFNTNTKVRWCRFDSTPALLEYDESNRAVFLGRLLIVSQRGVDWSA